MSPSATNVTAARAGSRGCSRGRSTSVAIGSKHPGDDNDRRTPSTVHAKRGAFTVPPVGKPPGSRGGQGRGYGWHDVVPPPPMSLEPQECSPCHAAALVKFSRFLALCVRREGGPTSCVAGRFPLCPPSPRRRP